MTATYCMHCSADLTAERRAADADADSAWDGAAGATSDTKPGDGGPSADAPGGLLDPEGLVDNGLTVLVGIVGGTVAGVLGTVVLGILTESRYGLLFGVVVWLLVTASLVRQRTVQGAVARSGYAIALVLLSVPLLAFSPALEPEGGTRGGFFVVLLVFAVVPAGVAAAVGWVASRFVPEGRAGSEG